MAKILLLNPVGEKLYLRDYYCSSSSKASYYWHPIDLLIQSGILNKNFDVSVIDAQVMNLSSKYVFKKIMDIFPDIIFFITGSASFCEDMNFIKNIKKNKDIKLIGSGDILRFEPEKILREYEFIEAILLNFTTDGIIKYLNNEYSENIMSKGGDKVDNLKSNNKYFSYPVPLHNLFPLKKYKLPFGKQTPFASVLTNYGCPFNCLYCNSGKLGFKLREIDNLSEEIYYITNKLNIFKIFFRDMTFTAEKAHLFLVCKEVKKYKLHWNCYSRIDTVDEGILLAMKDAGCYLIQFGIESGSEKILTKYKPEVKLSEMEKNILLCKKNRIEAIGHFIIGFPEDTERTIQETLKLALSIPLDGISLNIATPRYGSKFRERCIEDKLITPELIYMDNSSSYSIILNNDFSKARRYILLKYYIRISYILGTIKKIKSIKELQNIFSQGIGLIKNILGK